MEILFGLLIMIWDFTKPFFFASLTLICAVVAIKYLILDDITQKLDEVIAHLRTIERNEELIEGRIERIESYAFEMNFEMKNSLSSITKELRWWEKSTTAHEILQKLDSIERK